MAISLGIYPPFSDKPISIDWGTLISRMISMISIKNIWGTLISIKNIFSERHSLVRWSVYSDIHDIQNDSNVTQVNHWGYFMGYSTCFSSGRFHQLGRYTLWWFNIAIENGHWNSGFFPLIMVIFYSHVSLPEGMPSYAIIWYHLCHWMKTARGSGTAQALGSCGRLQMPTPVGQSFKGIPSGNLT